MGIEGPCDLEQQIQQYPRPHEGRPSQSRVLQLYQVRLQVATQIPAGPTLLLRPLRDKRVQMSHVRLLRQQRGGTNKARQGRARQDEPLQVLKVQVS